MPYRLITVTPAADRAGVEEAYALPKGHLVVGRRAGVDLLIADSTVSGRHARITVDDEGCTIADLESSNGTFVNGQRIAGTTRLRPGDRIVVGKVEFTLAGPAAEAPPPPPPAIAAATNVAHERALPQPAAPAPPPPRPEPSRPPAPAASPQPVAAPGPVPAEPPAGAVSRRSAVFLPGATVQQRIKLTPAAGVDDEVLAEIDAPSPEARFPGVERGGERGVRRIGRRRIELAAPGQAKAEDEGDAESGAKQRRPPPKRRHKVPTILQMEAVECGAAALAMILAHHGRWIPLEELRVQCGVSRDGSKASNLVKGARQLGMVAKGFKHDRVEDLYRLKYPVMLFWNFNHFVVLEGFAGGKAWINDPAQGPRSVTLDELDGAFSGIVLTFEPGPAFQRGGHRPSMINALRRRLAGSRAALTFLVVCGLFLVVPGLVVPTFTRIFIDEILVAHRDTLLRPLLVAMGITALLMMALTRFQSYYLLRLETKLALASSARFFHHVLRLPVTYFAQRYAGEIGSRVMINDRVAHLLSGRLATTILDCLLVVFYATLMFFYDVRMTLIGIGLSLLNIAAIRFASARRADASRLQLQEAGKLVGTAMNGLSSIETLKSSGGESEFFARWAGYQAKALRAEADLSLIGQKMGSVPGLVQMLITATVLFFGSSKVIAGEMSIGTLIAYQTLMMSFTRPLGTLVSFASSLQELHGDMSRLDDVLNHRRDGQYERAEEAGRQGKIKLDGKVELRGVTFGYNPVEPPLVEDFSLTIQPGQRVALVGSSGSGKSTVSKLVAGLYEPWKGEILFDDVPRRDLPHGLIVNSVAAVDQDIFLFGGTVRDNITMWDSTIPVARMTGAAKDAAVDDVIETRNGGYNSDVEEGGRNFSGGQRQRLEIARALIADPSVLILDEATSALDPTTEQRIDEQLRRRGCTCLIIAHRLSTIRDCDEIVVMHHGRIVQRGTHEQMKDVEGPYAVLIRE
jgi:NHLM bacteriocin system ABC transporter peptidase/ATP-binding protein